VLNVFPHLILMKPNRVAVSCNELVQWHAIDRWRSFYFAGPSSLDVAIGEGLLEFGNALGGDIGAPQIRLSKELALA
jgi:hypothetical protein